MLLLYRCVVLSIIIRLLVEYTSCQCSWNITKGHFQFVCDSTVCGFRCTAQSSKSLTIIIWRSPSHEVLTILCAPEVLFIRVVSREMEKKKDKLTGASKAFRRLVANNQTLSNLFRTFWMLLYHWKTSSHFINDIVDVYTTEKQIFQSSRLNNLNFFILIRDKK